MIKGGGGALTREKIVAAVAQRFVCIADQSKRVDVLGKYPLPVEVIPMARAYVTRELKRLGGSPRLRSGFTTDNGNEIIDVQGLAIGDPVGLERSINGIVGVVTNGLFAIRGADVLLLGTPDGVQQSRARIANHAARDAAMMRVALRWLAWLSGALIALLLAYLLAAVILGAIPVNAGFVQPDDGVPIFVRTNGVHAELVMPTQTLGVDWSEDHPPSDMRDLAQPKPWVAFGWGDRGFFVNTPTWGDLTLATAWTALSGVGEGAMHVEYVGSPQAFRAREVRLSATQYQRLVDYVRASFVRDGAGRPLRLDDLGYSGADAFYAAIPRYVFWFTSNEWVRADLPKRACERRCGRRSMSRSSISCGRRSR
jgi:uncharacterized protein (TIGR02117 family)